MPSTYVQASQQRYLRWVPLDRPRQRIPRYVVFALTQPLWPAVSSRRLNSTPRTRAGATRHGSCGRRALHNAGRHAVHLRTDGVKHDPPTLRGGVLACVEVHLCALPRTAHPDDELCGHHRSQMFVQARMYTCAGRMQQVRACPHQLTTIQPSSLVIEVSGSVAAKLI